MNLTIEQLKFAREIGATWRRDPTNSWFKEVDGQCYSWCRVSLEWNRATENGHPSEWEKAYKIDFSPLDDYYADKAVDIAATSVPDGYYHDDEEDKLKPMKPQAAPDMVNHPPHYQADGIECIDAIRAALGLEGFVAHCRGNAIKYSWRAGKKDEAAQDLRKAAWYLNRAADELEKQQ